MNELPELPFELVLSYLSLEDRIKARAVSRRWRDTINSFKVKSLCYSEQPKDFIEGKSRWVIGAFAQNFISSSRFISFFNTYAPSILSNLKHLRLCDLYPNEENRTTFIEILNSFYRLEAMDIIRFVFQDSHDESGIEFEPSPSIGRLSLPMLRSIHFERFIGIDQLTLDAPRLQQVKIHECFVQIELVHVESVERAIIDHLVDSSVLQLKPLKNLKQLYVQSAYPFSIDPTLLSSLKQLREIHLGDSARFREILELKRRYGLVDLKVYLYGLLLNGQDDRVMDAYRRPSSYFERSSKRIFIYLAENPSRLADEIPFCRTLDYSTSERVAPEVAINVVKRCTDLNEILVDKPVRDTERFLDFLKTFDKITKLDFNCDQPWNLFDRLPEHYVVQNLTIGLPSNHQFLFRFRHLVHLRVLSTVDAELIRTIFERLKFLSSFEFPWKIGNVQIEVDKIKVHLLKPFSVLFECNQYVFSNLNAAIKFMENNRLVKSRTRP